MTEQHAGDEQGESAQSSRKPSAKRKWRWRRILLNFFILLILLVVGITFLPLGDPATGSGLQIEVSKMESSNRFSMDSSVITTTSQSSFQCRRLVVINLSDHLLMRRAMPQVVAQLRKRPDIQQVDYCDGNTWPKTGDQLHDLYIVVDMPSIKESGMLSIGRTLDATISLSAGPGLWSPPTKVIDQYNVMQAHVGLSGSLDHHSVTRGYESAGAQYLKPAAEVAQQLGEHLNKTLDEWTAKHGAVGTIPAALIPAYQPVPADFPQLNLTGTEQLLSGHGFLVRNLTIWRVSSVDAPKAIEDMQLRLKQTGWKVKEQASGFESLAGAFRAERDTEVVEGFCTAGSVAGPKYQPAEVPRLMVMYSRRISLEEITQTIDQLLKQDDQLPHLASLFHAMKPPQQEQWVQRIIGTGSNDPALLLMAARHLHGQGREDVALDLVNQAWQQGYIDGQSQRLDEIKQLGEQITKGWKPLPPDEAMVKKLGYQRLELSTVSSAVTVKLDEPVLAYLTDVTGPAGGFPKGLVIVRVCVRRATIPEGVYTIEMRLHDLTNGIKSYTLSTPRHPPSPFRADAAHSLDQGSISALVQEISPQQFKITLFAPGASKIQTQPAGQ